MVAAIVAVEVVQTYHIGSKGLVVSSYHLFVSFLTFVFINVFDDVGAINIFNAFVPERAFIQEFICCKQGSIKAK